jgi:hypothetical protein
MSIKKYTNIDNINNNSENAGQFLQTEDLFIVSQNQIEDTDFGDCKYDVMEVSVYDINNNLLPQKSGNNVAYIKTGDIKNYMYSLTNKGGQKELAIDIEKLLNDLGFTNGILKVNVNFVRNKVGSDNELTKVWVHEISPSRTEIRILPLKTKNSNINNITNKEFTNINNLNKDFKYYKKNILDSLDSFEVTYLESITSLMVNRFGKDFESILRKDFGLSNFSAFKKRIFLDFKTSVVYWLTNKEYIISESNYGKASIIRFEECEQYEFSKLKLEIQNILRNCIDYNTKTLNRRNINIKVLPKEFEITKLKKEIKDLVGNIVINDSKVRNVYNPQNVKLDIKGVSVKETPIQITPAPIIKILPIETPIKVITPIDFEPIRVIKPLPIDFEPIEVQPIKIIEPPLEPQPIPIEDIIPTPSTGGGGGSTRFVPAGLNGTNSNYNGFDTIFSNVENDPTGRDY